MSDDMPPQGTASQEITCDYVVVSVNTDSRIAQVRFFNPYYSGTFTVEENEPIPPDPDNPDGDDEPRFRTKMVDKDPNPHMTKSVNVPFNESGPDLSAFADICTQQARGARNRMDAAYARHLASASAPIDLSSLVGLTNKDAGPQASVS